MAGLGLEDELAVLGSFIAGPEALRRFAGDAPLNTDDRPVVADRAPRATYAPEALPRDRLFALLQQWSIQPAELLLPTAAPDWSGRLAAYWTARDRFIASGPDVHPSPRVQDMLAQVREPLLAVLRPSRARLDPDRRHRRALTTSGSRRTLFDSRETVP